MTVTLAQALRHLVTGFVILGLWYFCDPETATNFFTRLGAGGNSVLALVIGAIAFYTYRPTIYQHGFLKILDKRQPVNVRSILMKWYHLKNRDDAESFWVIIQCELMSPRRESLELGSAGTHLLYITGIASAVASLSSAILKLMYGEPEMWKVLETLSVSIACCSCAVVSDHFLEQVSGRFLLAVERTKVDSLAKRMGFSVKAEEKKDSTRGSFLDSEIATHLL